MKKIILAVTLLAFAGSQVQTARAGDREWATAGKVLTGIAAASILTRAFELVPVYSAPVYTYATPAYCPPPAVVYQPAAPVVVCPPAPVVVYRQPVFVRPAPVVTFGFGFGFGGGHRFGPAPRGRW